MNTHSRIDRRRFLTAAACAVASGGPLAQTNSGVLRIVIGNPPGGTVDLLARMLAEDLGKSSGQAAIVENRPGANGNVAAEYVLRAPADGQTLFLAAPGPFVTAAALYPTLRFDPRTAFAPISVVAIAPLVLVVPAAFPVRSIKEFVAYAKANPGKISYGSQGNGSMGHLAMEMFRQTAGFDAVHIPYKGSSEAIQDLLAGNIQAIFDNTTSVLPQIRTGKLRALAVGERTRLPSLPDVPTVSEAGWNGFEATPWFAIAAPAATPRPEVVRLNTSIRAAIALPESQSRLAGLGIQPVGSSVEEFEQLLRTDTAKWTGVIKTAGITLS